LKPIHKSFKILIVFDKIARSEHQKTFINCIRQYSNSKKWMEENKDKPNRFAEWLQNQN